MNHQRPLWPLHFNDRPLQITNSAPIRTVALFEAIKGTLVLLAGCGVLALAHGDAQQLVSQVISHLHLNPAKHDPGIFIDLAGQMTNRRLWLLALGATLYALLRFIEAYGLWYGRRWAEWFAVLSGGVYIPFELREIAIHPGWLPWAALLVNIAVVGVMTYELKRRKPVQPI